MAQQQCTIFWHLSRLAHYQNWVFDREHHQNRLPIGPDWVWLGLIPVD
jgi:hypothetical protein